MEDLAAVEVTSIQSSGNCIRNITSDQYAGRAKDELSDPRPYCELLRQYSLLHPEFSYLPRKFKIAITGAPNDRAAVALHDIGMRMHLDDDGKPGFEVLVGGGQGRTPVIAETIREWLDPRDLLSYVEAILRIYNLHGRRDNIHKARIKIIVSQLGIERFRELVEAEWTRIRDSRLALPQAEIDRIESYFAPPDYRELADRAAELEALADEDPAFGQWRASNVVEHKIPGYSIVNLSLKATGRVPGDLDADRMDAVAALADRYSLGELRVTHRQNLVLTDVEQQDLYELWQQLDDLELATPNVGRLTDIVSCPGLDYCSLANARSIPVAQELSRHFVDVDQLALVGDLTVNVSGCMNACGHHHVGNIGILGVDKRGEEYFQLTLGGSSDEQTALGQRLGPALSQADVPRAVDAIVWAYLEIRRDGERFLDTVRRVGIEPFKAAVYGTTNARAVA
jgi:sulfite reductase (NADPH) hemoprotein beta-component